MSGKPLFPRRKAVAAELPHRLTLELGNVTIEVGQPIEIVGEQGEFKFKYVYEPDGSVACWGGPKGHEQFRAFPASRCRVKKAPRKRPQFTEEQLDAARERLAKARQAKSEQQA